MNKEEGFKVDWVNMLKLKASWGQQGNDNIGDYRYTDTFSLKNFNDQVAFVQSTVGNKNITWETNSNFNIGVDFELFKSRLTGSVEYFRRKTTDMLCIVYVPLSSGYFSSYDNLGDMLNQGVEIDLHYNVIRTKDFNWTVNFNATHYKNKVLMLNEDNKAVFYLMSRGISEEDARAMIVSGFANPVSKELPLEYAVEMNNLIQLEMKGTM